MATHRKRCKKLSFDIEGGGWRHLNWTNAALVSTGASILSWNFQQQWNYLSWQFYFTKVCNDSHCCVAFSPFFASLSHAMSVSLLHIFSTISKHLLLLQFHFHSHAANVEMWHLFARLWGEETGKIIISKWDSSGIVRTHNARRIFHLDICRACHYSCWAWCDAFHCPCHFFISTRAFSAFPSFAFVCCHRTWRVPVSLIAFFCFVCSFFYDANGIFARIKAFRSLLYTCFPLLFPFIGLVQQPIQCRISTRITTSQWKIER